MVTGSTKPISPAALKPEVYPHGHAVVNHLDFFFCLTTQTHTLIHLNTLILRGNRCDFAKRAVLSTATHCFLFHWPHWQQSEFGNWISGLETTWITASIGKRVLQAAYSTVCGRNEWVVSEHYNKTKCNNWNKIKMSRMEKKIQNSLTFFPSKLFSSRAFAVRHYFLLIRKVIGALLPNKVPQEQSLIRSPLKSP